MTDAEFDPATAHPLPQAFFARDPAIVAPELLGCVVATTVDGELTAGRVVEVEAYLGSDDPGSHAATKGMTARNAAMYGPPGSAYVYFTYGNHHMLNFVCCDEGTAGAVLVRALAPVAGVSVMTRRRGGRGGADLCNGPGKLTQALGIDLSDNRVGLGMGRVQVYDGPRPSPETIGRSGRVGLSNGHDLQLRFFVQGDPHVSRGRTGPVHRRRSAAGTGREESG